MKKLYFITILFLASYSISAQVGINTDSPISTLHILSDNEETPSDRDGVLIPRVTQLIDDPNIPNGMLVFYKKQRSPTDDENTPQQGFFWRKNNVWVPFLSTNQLTPDQTVTMVNTQSNFYEWTSMNGQTIRNNALLKFDAATLKANDEDNFSVTADGNLKVTKAGNYIVQSTLTFFISTEPNDISRDALEVILQKNGNDVSAPVIRSSFSYPMSAGMSEANGSVSLNGFITLSVNDELSIRVQRYYRDVDGGWVLITPVGEISTLTLRYIGN